MKLLTITEVAERLQSSRRFVADELRRKNMRGSNIGAGWRVTEDDLNAYIEAHMNVTPVRGRSA